MDEEYQNSKSTFESMSESMDAFIGIFEKLVLEYLAPLYVFLKTTPPLNYILYTIFMLYLINLFTGNLFKNIFKSQKKFEYNKELPADRKEIQDNIKFLRTEFAQLKESIASGSLPSG